MSSRCRSWMGVGAVAAALACAGALGTSPAEGGGSLGHDPRVELGRRLFFDPAVSKSGDNSCASCHEPAHGFSSPKKRNLDDFNTTRRHSQTLLDTADGKSFHWDGEFRTVAELVTARLGDLTRTSGRSRRAGPGSSYGGGPSPTPTTPTTPFFDPEEPPVTTGDDPEADVARLLATLDGRRLERGADAPGGAVPALAQRIEDDGRYADGFQSAFGSPRVTVARIAQAIEAYVGTIRSTDSAFDRYASGDKDALSESARRGLALFKGRAGCVSCHRMDGLRPRFTDESFHNTGVSAHAVIGRPTMEVSRQIPADLLAKRDPGRQPLTRIAGDEGAFKTPTLRDVALRPPFMHDGAFKTLEDVVRYYVKGGTPDPQLDERMKPFKADDRDVDDLVEFMTSLTGDTRPGLAPTAGRRAAASASASRIAPGSPSRACGSSRRPDGDVVPADGPMEPVTLTTDANGMAVMVPGPAHPHAPVPARRPPPAPGLVGPRHVRLPAPARARPRSDLAARHDARRRRPWRPCSPPSRSARPSRRRPAGCSRSSSPGAWGRSATASRRSRSTARPRWAAGRSRATGRGCRWARRRPPSSTCRSRADASRARCGSTWAARRGSTCPTEAAAPGPDERAQASRSK